MAAPTHTPNIQNPFHYKPDTLLPHAAVHQTTLPQTLSILLPKTITQNLQHPHLLLALLILPPLILLLHTDYQSFLSLGPGGTPSTPRGYLRVTFLKLLFSRNDTYTPPVLTSGQTPSNGYLCHLPVRQGPRPSVAGIAPHRQTSQKGTASMHAQLVKEFHALRSANEGVLGTGISCFEKRCLALFFTPRALLASAGMVQCSKPTQLARTHSQPRNPLAVAVAGAGVAGPWSVSAGATAVNATCGHPAEIAHLHSTESSMHLTLHPLDAALVICNQWGERHPLAGRGPWVPRGFVMVYAPRNGEEVRVVMEIVRAGAWWVGGCALADGVGVEVEVEGEGKGEIEEGGKGVGLLGM